MGLSGRKIKQRIPDDPRNLCWADDAARFGSNYLAKFGWDGSKGLGVAGDGRTSHIKVSHKLDLLGIGAAQQNNTDGIAWKQNKDFECLLQRLNNASAGEKNQTLESGKEKEEQITYIAEKKRKYMEDGQSKTERKKKKKAKTDDDEVQSPSNIESTAIQPERIELTVVEVKNSGIIPRHRAHRARAINAKNISSKSAAHISEILGIAPIPSGSPSDVDSAEPSRGKLTSLTDEVETEMITTSTKTVTDYFKEKLNTRFSSAIVSTSTTPRDFDDSYDTPRLGLGSRARNEISIATGEIGQETQRMGLSTISAFSSPLACEKTLKDSDAEDPATAFRMNVNPNPQTKGLEGEKKKKRNEGIGEDDSARDDRNETRERGERKRKRKLNREKNDHVEPQDFDKDLKELKKEEKRKRKAENLEVITSHHTDTPVDDAYVEKPQKKSKKNKKGCKSNRVDHTKVHVS